MTIQFWTNEPTVLFNKDYIFDLWPTSEMCYEQKLNAITRLIIIITILAYILTMNNRILVAGFFTILVIFILYKMRKQKITKEFINEGFNVQGNNISGLSSDFNSDKKSVTLKEVLKTEFKEGNRKNPFSNVLLTQIMDDPDRNAAPPSFNVDVAENITKNTKKTVQMLNPEIKNTDKQLFGDLWENFELDQSNRAFYSTANTRVTNDQGAYAEYLYGDLKYSAKESTPEGNMQRVLDNYRYTLY
jgi:hypothetical protein